MKARSAIRLACEALFLAAALTVAGCATLPTQLGQVFVTQTPDATATPLATPTPAATSAPLAAPTVAGTPRATNRQPGAKAQAAILQGMRALGLEGGVVTTNDGGSLGIKLGKNTDQIAVSANTIVAIPGKTDAHVSDIQVGDRVVAKVPKDGSNAAATLVLDFPASYTAANVLVGAVQSNANGTLTVRGRGAARQVSVDTTTLIVSITNGKPSVVTSSSITRGNTALILGKQSGNNLGAQVIILLDRNSIPRGGNRKTPTATPTPGSV